MPQYWLSKLKLQGPDELYLKLEDVSSEAMKQKVEAVLAGHPEAMRKMVVKQPAWYY